MKKNSFAEISITLEIDSSPREGLQRIGNNLPLTKLKTFIVSEDFFLSEVWVDFSVTRD